MKRLFKFLVAAATSFSLLIANIPLAQFTVRADEMPVYTFTNEIAGDREVVHFVNGEVVLEGGAENTFAPGTIELRVETGDGLSVSGLEIRTREDGRDQTLSMTDSYYEYQIDSYFKVVNIKIENGNGILEIIYTEAPAEDKPDVTFTIYSSVKRIIEFNYGDIHENNTELGISDEPYEITVNGMPDSFTIFNPGGMGTEELRRLKDVTINGTSVDVTARYDTCTFSLEGIEGTAVTIVLEGDDTPGGVIEWTNYYCDEEHRQGNISAEEQFNYGSAKVVGVYAADDTNFTNNIMDQYGIDDNGCVDEYGNGGLRLENGFWIAFEFIPLPGYQLVEFGGGAGGQGGSLDIGTTDRPNVYYFQMPEGNCHFTAVFDTPENIVKINGGSIVNDGAVAVAEDEFAGGTAQMTVGALSNDVQAAYNQNRDFTEALEENDLEVQEYLSLDLANIYQKANTDEYWEEEYHELEKGDATVTLKVAGNFNPNNNKVYIVHDLGDGEGVETIEADYNPNTHEITFETGSFSNFMIATSDEANDIDVKPNEPPKPGDPEPGEPQPGEPEPGAPDDFEDYAPHFSLALVDDEVLLGNWEGEDNPFFVPVDEGQIIPSDAAIDNELPEDLPDDIELIYFIDDEEVASYYMDERETFTPGHFVVFEGIAVTEDTFEVYFKSCWIVAIDVIYMDLSMTVQDKDGKVIEPINVPEDVDYPVFECGDATKEDYTFYELAFITQPAEVVVKGINGYALFYLGCNDEDVYNTPIGENYIKCPDEDYIWIGAWGFIPESETVDFTYSLSTASAVFDGVSADKAKDYLVVIDEIDLADAPAEDVAAIKKQLEEKGYTGVSFPMGFEINLFDKNGFVHEPGFTVRITLVLKKALELKDGEKVWILHLIDDDKFEVIEAVYNATNLTLTFETKTFSPFVVMIGTQAAPAPVVKTGEDINVTRIVIASLLIGAAAAAGILFIKRREYEIEKEEN